MTQQFTESLVENAALSWFKELDYAVVHGPHIAPDELHAERKSFSETVLAKRLRDALLPKLLSGEIRVKSPEPFVQA